MLTYDLFLLLSGLILLAVSIYLFTNALLSSNADADQLAWATGDEPSKSKSPIINFSRPLVHNFALQHAQKIKSKRYRKNIKNKILTAGLSKEINVDEFIGIQILWGILFPIVLIVLNFALRLELPLVLCLGLGGFGAYFPHLYCNTAKTDRSTSVIADLPFFVDLLALSTKAGLDFIGAIQRIVDKAENSVLADELANVLQDIKLGSSRTEALKALASRLALSEITSFVSVVIDADQTGANIYEVLQEQSEQMRLERFVRAEKAGARASQLIMIPMMAFILPAVFVTVFAPVVIQFFYGGN